MTFFFHFHCLDWISRKGTRRRVRCVINKFISKFNSFHLSFVGSWEMPTTIIITMIVADKRHETCDDRFEVVNRHYDRFLLWSIFVSDKDEVVSLSEWQSESRQKINCGCFNSTGENIIDLKIFWRLQSKVEIDLNFTRKKKMKLENSRTSCLWNFLYKIYQNSARNMKYEFFIFHSCLLDLMPAGRKTM